jgi:hypothetical protein
MMDELLATGDGVSEAFSRLFSTGVGALRWRNAIFSSVGHANVGPLLVTGLNRCWICL